MVETAHQWRKAAQLVSGPRSSRERIARDAAFQERWRAIGGVEPNRRNATPYHNHSGVVTVTS